MCGGGLGKQVFDTGEDLLAATVGNAFGGPLGAAALTAGANASQGGNLQSDLIAGGTAGVGTGVSDLVSGASLTGSGLSGIENALSSAGNFITGGGPSGGSTPTTSGTSPLGAAAPSTTPSAAASPGVGGGAGSIAAPSSVSTDFSQGLGTSGSQNIDTGGFTNIANQLNNSGDLGTVGSPSTSTSNVGTPSIPTGGGNLTQQFAQAAGGSPSLDTSGLNNLGSTLGETAATPAPTSVQNFLAPGGQTLGNFGNIISANPGAAISAAGLGINALEGAKSLEGERQLKQEASNEAGQGAQLESYLQTGTLPPGLQAGVNQASQAAIATIKSQYAAMGMSGSSAEQQDIAAVQQQAEAAGAQMAMQLLNTGIQETGMSSALYQALLKQATSEDSALSSSIANFASAASGGGGQAGGFKIVQTGAGGTV